MKSVRRLKVLLRAATGRGILIRPDVLLATERFGSDDGGWDILTSSIDRHSIVYSFGVGEDTSFDTALIERFDLTVHAFDPTPKSIAWVKRQAFTDRFVMHEYGIASSDGVVSLYPPENPDHVSHTMLERPVTRAQAISVSVKRLDTIMKELGHDRLDILKMDIEGAEYEVFDDLSNSDVRPQQILVEFHHRFPGVGVRRTREAIATIRSMGYRLFSVSAANEEFCFVLDHIQ